MRLVYGVDTRHSMRTPTELLDLEQWSDLSINPSSMSTASRKYNYVCRRHRHDANRGTITLTPPLRLLPFA